MPLVRSPVQGSESGIKIALELPAEDPLKLLVFDLK